MNVEDLLHDTFSKYEDLTPDVNEVHEEIWRRLRPSGRMSTTTGTRRGRLVPAVASAAVVLAVGGVIAAVSTRGGSDSDSGRSVGAPYNPPSSLSNAFIEKSQVSYRVEQQIELDAAGNAIPNSQDAMVDRSWVSTNGDIRSVRSGSQTGCMTFAGGTPDLESPDLAFFRSMPTDVSTLESYLRSTVSGSSSRDEAVFVAVGDALRTADGLATPTLRAAMLAVLSRTAGVTIHEQSKDYLGRAAIRADFVDEPIRPGEVHSYYFDPSTYQLLEERQSLDAGSQTYVGPSPAYTAAAPSVPVSSDELTGAAFIEVMRTESVLDRLPPLPTGCTNG